MTTDGEDVQKITRRVTQCARFQGFILCACAEEER